MYLSDPSTVKKPGSCMCLSLLRRNALIIRRIQYASDHVSECGQMWRKMYDSSSLLKFFGEVLADFAVMTL
jgi:hypothetical protein